MNKTGNALLEQAKDVGASNPAAVTGSARRVLRVWLVDDNAALRELFAELLGKQPGIRCARQFDSAEAILATLAEERPPDMILLDVNLGSQNGLSAIRPILKLAPKVKVVMLTMFSNSYYEQEAFRAEASGFLLKSYELEELVRLIHEAQRNPGARELFPNLSLREEAELAPAAGVQGSPSSTRRFSVVGALRQLCGVRRRAASG